MREELSQQQIERVPGRMNDAARRDRRDDLSAVAARNVGKQRRQIDRESEQADAGGP
jgi:hypothetical protein